MALKLGYDRYEVVIYLLGTWAGIAVEGTRWVSPSETVAEQLNYEFNLENYGAEYGNILLHVAESVATAYDDAVLVKAPANVDAAPSGRVY